MRIHALGSKLVRWWQEQDQDNFNCPSLQKYKMTLLWKHVNYLFLLATLAGMVLFFMAPTLCRNTFFHYTTGELKMNS